MKLVRTVSLIFLASCLLTACVTETTGGFNTQASRDRVVEDYIQLAVGYFEADNMVRAKRNLRNALQINPDSSQAHALRALIHQREGEQDLAREKFRRALDLNPDNSRARNNFAAFLFTQGDYEAAYEQLQIVAEDTDYESRAMAFQNLGLAAVRTDRNEEAEQAFERALMLDSNMYRSALELAQLKFDQGRFAEAKQYYDQFEVSRQFLDISQTASSLLLGYRLATRFDNQEQAQRYGNLLEEQFPDSQAHRRYQQLSEDESAEAEG